MHHCPRTILILILTLVIALSVHPQPALADVAPPAPPTGSNISPNGDSTNVRMVSETVEIDVASSSDYDTGQAGVRADFDMRNLGQSEENMQVRFPLCINFVNYQESFGLYPPLANFNVWVNGVKTGFTTSNEEKMKWSSSDTVEVACWAIFPVVFPVGKDVYITVAYKQAGFTYDLDNYVDFPYILFTGANWKDTIVSADIIERLPMPVNDLTVMNPSPDGAVIQGSTIHWHMQNLDPGSTNGMIEADVLQPKYWFDLQNQLQNVKAHPNDGEAWGLLGKAYKQVIVQKHGVREDQEQMYRDAIQAYQKAVTLKPRDADWHYGFADLLCWDLPIWANDTFDRTQADVQKHLHDCADQTNQTLAINPNYPGMSDFIQGLSSNLFSYENGRVSVADGIDYSEFGSVPAPTFVDLNAFTPTPTWSAREPSVTTFPTSRATLAALPAQTPTPSAPGSNSNWFSWAGGLGLAILLAGLAWLMRAKRGR
jgi:hypothetical protein